LHAWKTEGLAAAAHFAIPPQYLIPDNLNSSAVYQNSLPFAEDRGRLAAVQLGHTAFAHDTDCPPHKLPIHSFYQRMRERNPCIHPRPSKHWRQWRSHEQHGTAGRNHFGVAADQGGRAGECVLRADWQ
jgi:hypothetical protein